MNVEQCDLYFKDVRCEGFCELVQILKSSNYHVKIYYDGTNCRGSVGVEFKKPGYYSNAMEYYEKQQEFAELAAKTLKKI